jgi:septum formation protein
LGISFKVDPSGIDETPLPNEKPEALVARLARSKALTTAEKNGGDPARPVYVLGADTIVLLDGRIIGKPSNPAEAVRFLRDLSGKTHVVMTAFCLVRAPDKIIASGASRSRVSFRPLSPAEIEAYVKGGEPMDKAGAYAAQGEGKRLIREIRGSVPNVIGLPTEELVPWFKKVGLLK